MQLDGESNVTVLDLKIEHLDLVDFYNWKSTWKTLWIIKSIII